MSVAQYFSNIKIGKKLGAGFITIIAISLIIAYIAFDCFTRIKDNSTRRSVMVKMVNTLSDARLNRTLYQYTKDNQFAVRNGEALNQLTTLNQQLNAFSWDSEGRTKVKQLSQLISEYQRQQTQFVTAARETTRLATTMQPDMLISVAQQLSEFDMSELSEAALPAVHLAARLYDAALLTNSFLDTPSYDASDTLTEKLNAAVTLSEQLNGFSQEKIDVLTRPLLLVINQLRPSLTPYIIAFDKEHQLSVALISTAERLNSEVAAMFVWQSKTNLAFISGAETRIAITALICVLLSLLLAWQITRNITQPLRSTLNAAQRIAGGDLTTSLRTTRNDELGQLMQAVDTMNQSLQTIISNVRSNVSSVARASAEIAAGNIDLSARTEEQSAAVVQTAASMEELTSTVKQNAGNAHHASQLATDASGNAGRGGEIVRNVVTTMSGISQSSGKIGEIISVINSIAFQTNILALNAAVEAARAGEQGRGFAVVAGEVRNLAQRSSVAAKEIETLIRDSLNRVNDGAALVDRAGNVMEEIVQSVTQVRDIMGEIAAASDEQNRGISQIAQAMSELDSTTQQNAALVEQSSAAASSLESQARELEGAIAIFRLQPESEPAGQTA